MGDQQPFSSLPAEPRGWSAALRLLACRFQWARLNGPWSQRKEAAMACAAAVYSCTRQHPFDSKQVWQTWTSLMGRFKTRQSQDRCCSSW